MDEFSEFAIEPWLATLSKEARIVASTALALNKNIIEAYPAVGGCYHSTFFMFEYFRSMFGIDVEPVVGWVNDGRDAVMIPHAWIEFENTITDISLTQTEYPEQQLRGALIVIDKIIRPGQLSYTYHKARTAEAMEALVLVHPDELAESEERQAFMTAISKSPKQIRAYLKSAPPKLSFRVLAAAAQNKPIRA